MAPPLIRARETTLSGTPSPPLQDRHLLPSSVEGSVPPPDGGRSPSGRSTEGMASASAAPTLVGVAETAPPWYVSLLFCF